MKEIKAMVRPEKFEEAYRSLRSKTQIINK